MAKAWWTALVLALVLAASSVVVPQAAAASPGSFLDIDGLDKLIVEQEELLHAYRCRFDVDVQLVPGGCRNGMPVRPVESTPPFNGTPTAEDVVQRIRVLESQLSLLNTYRCRFGADVEAVFGGCANLKKLDDVDEPGVVDQPDQPDEPASSESQGGWVSFDEARRNHPGLTRPRQLGVLTESIASTRVPHGLNAELVVACLIYGDERQDTLRAYVNWNIFITSRIGIYNLAVEYSDGGSRSFLAINSTANEASFLLNTEESNRFAQSIIDSDGDTVTASVFIPFGGWTISATFDLNGSTAAIQPVLNRCHS